jgi:hypothetical protein
MKNNNNMTTLPTNFDDLSQYDKILTLLNMAFDYPMEYKVLPLSKLWNIDRNIAENILNQTTENSTEQDYNKVIMSNILDLVKNNLVVSK